MTRQEAYGKAVRRTCDASEALEQARKEYYAAEQAERDAFLALCKSEEDMTARDSISK